jgi:hypothetical protein
LCGRRILSGLLKEISCVFNDTSGMTTASHHTPKIEPDDVINDDLDIYITNWRWHTLNDTSHMQYLHILNGINVFQTNICFVIKLSTDCYFSKCNVSSSIFVPFLFDLCCYSITILREYSGCPCETGAGAVVK